MSSYALLVLLIFLCICERRLLSSFFLFFMIMKVSPLVFDSFLVLLLSLRLPLYPTCMYQKIMVYRFCIPIPFFSFSPSSSPSIGISRHTTQYSIPYLHVIETYRHCLVINTIIPLLYLFSCLVCSFLCCCTSTSWFFFFAWSFLVHILTHHNLVVIKSCIPGLIQFTKHLVLVLVGR